MARVEKQLRAQALADFYYARFTNSLIDEIENIRAVLKPDFFSARPARSSGNVRHRVEIFPVPWNKFAVPSFTSMSAHFLRRS